MKQIVLASGNPGKLKELQQALQPLSLELVLQSDFGLDSADETGLTFVENAILKARHVAQATGLPALADDSGLEVDALQGQPGIYSARFAGPDATDADNNSKLLADLANVEPAQRSARFHCVLVLMRHATDPTPVIAHASWEGQILTAPQGDNGFGYDPLFLIPDLGQTSAQLSPTHKNKISHRGQAITELIRQLS